MKVFKFSEINSYSCFRNSEKVQIENSIQRAYEVEIELAKLNREQNITYSLYHTAKAVKLESIFNELRDL